MLSDCGTIWFDKPLYDQAETRYYLWLQKKLYGIEVEDTPVVFSSIGVSKNKSTQPQQQQQQSKGSKKNTESNTQSVGSLSAKVAATRQQIRESLAVSNESASSSSNLITQQLPTPPSNTVQNTKSAGPVPRAGSAVRNQTLPTPQPMPTNAKKKRRNRNRSRRKRSKSARANSCCQSVSPGRLSVAPTNSLQTQGNSDMATTQQVEELKKTVNYLVDALKKVELGMSSLENANNSGTPQKAGGAAKAPAKAAPKKPADDDDDVDLFGSDDDEEADAVRQERLKAYAEKKSKKPAVIAKSSVVMDVKPWDDETDMKELEKAVRSVQMDGLTWGTSKLMPVGYGIQKLQIVCVVEDDKVSIDELTEKLSEFEDYVQSVDIAAFNKI